MEGGVAAGAVEEDADDESLEVPSPPVPWPPSELGRSARFVDLVPAAERLSLR